MKFIKSSELVCRIRAVWLTITRKNFILISMKKVNGEVKSLDLLRRTDFTDESDIYIMTLTLEQFKERIERENTNDL